ncbi:Hypothetical predicted protein [Paramuricea clavata]|uniref:Uncharacterized protein n=1 Tax=Paramuricea clavata TaxID=317549 RepID=A0A7D9J6Q4_PARCT|nr:Hypothetical predicted protein [Paramuricea clavata]
MHSIAEVTAKELKLPFLVTNSYAPQRFMSSSYLSLTNLQRSYEAYAETFKDHHNKPDILYKLCGNDFVYDLCGLIDLLWPLVVLMLKAQQEWCPGWKWILQDKNGRPKDDGDNDDDCDNDDDGGGRYKLIAREPEDCTKDLKSLAAGTRDNPAKVPVNKNKFAKIGANEFRRVVGFIGRLPHVSALNLSLCEETSSTGSGRKTGNGRRAELRSSEQPCERALTGVSHPSYSVKGR